MTFDDLKTELFARGTNYLEEDAQGVARAERWLNQAYREILNLHAWPFLVSTATGATGSGEVSIPDLRKLLLVANTEFGETPGRPLGRVTYEDLVGDFVVDLARTGAPEFYYVENSVVHAYPVGGTIFARYIRRVDALSGSQEPVFRDEYHDLIVDRAMVKAYKDSDNFEAAAALREEFNSGVTAMAEDYQVHSRDTVYLQGYGEDA